MCSLDVSNWQSLMGIGISIPAQPTLDRLNEKRGTGHLRADKALDSEEISVLRAVRLKCCFLPVLSAGADHDLNGICEWEDF